MGAMPTMRISALRHPAKPNFMIRNIFKKNLKFTDLDKSQFKTMMNKDNTLIIDVRTPYEYMTGHIDNSLNIDIMNNEFNTMLNKLNKTSNILVYCRSGARSQIACEKIINLGFNNVYNLADGYNKW